MFRMMEQGSRQLSSLNYEINQSYKKTISFFPLSIQQLEVTSGIINFPRDSFHLKICLIKVENSIKHKKKIPTLYFWLFFWKCTLFVGVWILCGTGWIKEDKSRIIIVHVCAMRWFILGQISKLQIPRPYNNNLKLNYITYAILFNYVYLSEFFMEYKNFSPCLFSNI